MDGSGDREWLRGVGVRREETKRIRNKHPSLPFPSHTQHPTAHLYASVSTPCHDTKKLKGVRWQRGVARMRDSSVGASPAARGESGDAPPRPSSPPPPAAGRAVMGAGAVVVAMVLVVCVGVVRARPLFFCDSLHPFGREDELRLCGQDARRRARALALTRSLTSLFALAPAPPSRQSGTPHAPRATTTTTTTTHKPTWPPPLPPGRA
jgi:hypothetical protein